MVKKLRFVLGHYVTPISEFSHSCSTFWPQLKLPPIYCRPRIGGGGSLRAVGKRLARIFLLVLLQSDLRASVCFSVVELSADTSRNLINHRVLVLNLGVLGVAKVGDPEPGMRLWWLVVWLLWFLIFFFLFDICRILLFLKSKHFSKSSFSASS